MDPLRKGISAFNHSLSAELYILISHLWCLLEQGISFLSFLLTFFFLKQIFKQLLGGKTCVSSTFYQSQCQSLILRRNNKLFEKKKQNFVRYSRKWNKLNQKNNDSNRKISERKLHFGREGIKRTFLWKCSSLDVSLPRLSKCIISAPCTRDNREIFAAESHAKVVIKVSSFIGH